LPLLSVRYLYALEYEDKVIPRTFVYLHVGLEVALQSEFLAARLALVGTITCFNTQQ
jgi:hypothetical protein